MIDPHSVLGVSHSATRGEIKKAYRLLAKKLHPDRNKSANANEQFVALQSAYEQLISRGLNIVDTRPSTPQAAKHVEQYVWGGYAARATTEELENIAELARKLKKAYSKYN